MNNKIILDLCGGTGAWSKPYKSAGYEVHVITLPEYDVTRVEFGTFAIGFMPQTQQKFLTIPYNQVYGILAAPPPCTEFSLAKGAAQRNFQAAMEIVDACLQIIWHCRFYKGSKLKFWSLENPVGFLRQFLGKPVYTFEQWQFKDEGIKPTDLWGYFRNPTPIVIEKPANLSIINPNGRKNGRGISSPKCPSEYKHLNLSRADKRAITPAGFAQAFFRANK